MFKAILITIQINKVERKRILTINRILFLIYMIYILKFYDILFNGKKFREDYR